MSANDGSELMDIDHDEQLRQAAAERNYEKVKSLLERGAGKTSCMICSNIASYG